MKEIEPSANSSKANVAKILVIRGQAQIALPNPDEGGAAISQAIGFDLSYGLYIPAWFVAKH